MSIRAVLQSNVVRAVGIVVVLVALTQGYFMYIDYTYSSSCKHLLFSCWPNFIAAQNRQSVSSADEEEPLRVVIDAIGIDTPVTNPSSTDKGVLDAAMYGGAIRYPTSALLGQEGTMVLLGHSSNLPFVRNKGYKAFNGIQKLENGEIVKVYSDQTEYRYAVKQKRLVRNGTDNVELESGGIYLVLLTTDLRDRSLNTRWLIDAEFIGSENN